MELGMLYVVATPIGNLEDITLRAIRILKEVDIILAEDTRKTSILLKHFDIKSNVLSYHHHSSDTKKAEILRYLLEGKNIALVTDAGTPGISDPGNELISYLHSFNPQINIIPVPGASAVTALLSVSGKNVSKFVHLGFLPKKKLKKELKWVQETKIPFVFFESPYRIAKTLDVLQEIVGEKAEVVIGRELTKVYEVIIRGTLKEVKTIVETTDRRGEYVVLVSPSALKSGQVSKEK